LGSIRSRRRRSGGVFFERRETAAAIERSVYLETLIGKVITDEFDDIAIVLNN